MRELFENWTVSLFRWFRPELAVGSRPKIQDHCGAAKPFPRLGLKARQRADIGRIICRDCERGLINFKCPLESLNLSKFCPSMNRTNFGRGKTPGRQSRDYRTTTSEKATNQHMTNFLIQKNLTIFYKIPFFK